jgi:hypothetical protein
LARTKVELKELIKEIRKGRQEGTMKEREGNDNNTAL